MAGKASRCSILSLRLALWSSTLSCLSRSPRQYKKIRPQTRAFCSAVLLLKQRKDTPFQHSYEHIEAAELIESYLPGGYHPVAIGDIFNARYRVVHKLGHGTFSTIWLAQDQKSNRYVAIKVCTADANPREISVLEELSHSRRPGADRVKPMTPIVLDKFYTEGPNGAHACFVTHPARMSVAEAMNESHNRLFQIDVARALTAQLVVAIDFVHSHGFVHGDIHLGNVLLRMPDKLNKEYNGSQLSVQELYKEHGEPIHEPVRRFDNKPLPPGVPSHVVIPIWLGKPSDRLTLPEANLILSDFGEAFAPEKKQIFESHTPFVSRAPETLFEPQNPISFPSDIWSLGCTIWNVFAESPVFDNILATQDDIVCEQVDALGPLPEEWWNKWDGRHSRFTENGKPKNRNPYRSWDDRFEDSIQQPRQKVGMAPIESREREELCSLLRAMLSFRPERRPSTKEILQSKWIVEWAMPQYRKLQSAT